jgi:hypothetical protein
VSEEEREARLRQMQADAEVHEEQRWKRLKKAADDDAKETSTVSANQFEGKNFLEDEKRAFLEPRRVAAPPLKRASGAELIIHRVAVMLSRMHQAVN